MNSPIECQTFLKSTEFQNLLLEVATKLRYHKLTISSAESCTGGLFSTLLTELSGSSQFFRCGVVAYDNLIKIRLLGIEPHTLQRFGAVSAPVAQAMAQGVKNLSNSDINVSFTGIAGPTGGSEEKPVGLVYLSLAFKNPLLERKFNDIIDVIIDCYKKEGILITSINLETTGTCNFEIRNPQSSNRSTIRWNSCTIALDFIRNGLGNLSL